MQGLLEGHFDFEAESIQFDDFERGKGQVGGHEQNRAPAGMRHCDKAHQDPGRPPEEIGGGVPKDHVGLPVDWARGLDEISVLGQERGDRDLATVLPRSPPGPSPLRRRLGRHVRHTVAFDARHQMVALFQEPTDHPTRGIIGIGQEVKRLMHPQPIQEMNHFIQECALITIGQDQALVDAAGQREGATRRPHPCEDGDRLTGVPEDILRLGVRVGCLVQLFDGRHFPP